MNAPATSRDLQPGERVGEYEIVGVLGRGGFATVYEGVQPIIGKRVAVKVLDPRHASEDGVTRFVREARAVNQIAHDNIVDVFSFGQLSDGRHFFVMDLLRGAPLDRLIEERGRLSLAEALPILRGIAMALDAAHGRQIVHRDLKPENVFIAIDDHGTMTSKVLDFGLAKHFGATAGLETQSGVLMGTPAYMSPEQARCRSVDHRTDIYSFGVVAYEMLTGKLPFTGDDHLAVLVKHTADAPPLVSAVVPEVDSRVDRAISALLEKDPDARPKTLADAVRMLEGTEAESLDAVVLPFASPTPVGSGAVVAVRAPAFRLRWIIAAGFGAAVLASAWFVARVGSGVAAPPGSVLAGASRRDSARLIAIAPAAAASAASVAAVLASTLADAPRVAPSASAVPSGRPIKHASNRPPQLDDVEDPFKGR